MRRGKAIRRKMVSPWGSTEDYMRRLAARENPQVAAERRRLAKVNSSPDGRINNLIKYIKSLNERDPRFYTDPLELDHIVPISQGGTHTYENLIGVRRSLNRRDSQFRTPEEIKRLQFFKQHYDVIE